MEEKTAKKKNEEQVLTPQDQEWMEEAVRLSAESIHKGGGPFGAVIVKDGMLTLELHYRVYPECDVITRCCRLVNHGKEQIELDRLMSTQPTT